MTESAASAADRHKLDEDDHDLLTFSEAGERLRLEIAAAERRVNDLADHGSAAELDSVRRRLEALLAAARRNSAQPINDANFERFFGYPGKARRNLATDSGSS